MPLNPWLGLLSLIALGLFLGMRHATDPDHVVAVATIVTRQPALGKAARIGAFWGLGHATTITAVGAAIILLKVVIPPRLGLGMELAVGLMLILLGALNLAGVAPVAPHHSHWTTGNARPFAIGIVHGLAGSAAVALLVLAAIPRPGWALAYLAVFGAGTIAGMMLITLGMAGALIGAAQRAPAIGRRLNFASGLLSLAFGLFVAYQIGIVQGLFTSHPHWTPH